MQSRTLTLRPVSEEQITQKDMAQNNKISTPYTIKNRVLMAPGYWNETYYSAEEVRKAYENTDWSDKDNTSLILDHEDTSVKSWVGWIKNPRMDGDNIIGDLELWDEDTIKKLVHAKAKFGISPKVVGTETDDKQLIDFAYKNFSVVTNPAVKKAYINLSQKNPELQKLQDQIDELKPLLSKFLDNEQTKEMKGREEIRKDKGMSVEEFYAAPRDPPSSSDLPIYDASHVRNAMARFNQTEFKSQEEKKKAKRKIIQAAKKFDIKVDEFKKVGPELEDKSQSESDSTKLNDGGKTMANESNEEAEQKDSGEAQEQKEQQAQAQEQQQASGEKKDESNSEASEEKESELSDDELANITQKSDFPQFVKKMREKDATMSFKSIAKAYKEKQENLSQFENMDVKELTDQLEKILNVLKSKKESTQENSQKSSQQSSSQELSQKDKDAQSVQQQETKELSNGYGNHTAGALAFAGMLKKMSGTGQSTIVK